MKAPRLDGAKIYQLTIPAGIPARDFWSFIVYDAGNRSTMATSQKFPAKSTYDDVVASDDGMIDLYFGPKAPSGKENNWIETDAAQGWTGIFRLYGPEEGFFDQSRKLNDLELIG